MNELEIFPKRRSERNRAILRKQSVVFTAIVYIFVMALCVLPPPTQAVPIVNLSRKGVGLYSSNPIYFSRSEFKVETIINEEHEVYKKISYPILTDDQVQPNRTSISNVQRGKLHSRYHYLVQINPDGTVNGTTDYTSSYTKLEIHSMAVGMLMIIGIESNRYLTITDDGLLTGEKQPSLNSVFIEKYLSNHYQSYMSYKFRSQPWLVGIKKSGRPKRAQHTRVGQKATLFMMTKD